MDDAGTLATHSQLTGSTLEWLARRSTNNTADNGSRNWQRMVILLSLAGPVILLILSNICVPHYGPAGLSEATQHAEGYKAGSIQRTAAPLTHVPRHLAKLLVCLTIKWEPKKLAVFEMVLRVTATYRTVVDVLIVTDNVPSLRQAVQRMSLPYNYTFWDTKPPAQPDHNAWLAWEHREAIKAAVGGVNYTAIMYSEEDHRVTWQALVSWALDTEVLEPTGRVRCVRRVETDVQGRVAMLDMTTPASLSRICKVDAATDPATASIYEEKLTEINGKICDLVDGTAIPCQLHRYFCSPSQPYQGMFITTRQQLDKYMSSPLWDKQDALKSGLVDWGYLERASSIQVMVDKPTDCASNCMVPYINAAVTGGGSSVQLSPLSWVDHLPNRYSTDPRSPHGKLPAADALQP